MRLMLRSVAASVAAGLGLMTTIHTTSALSWDNRLPMELVNLQPYIEEAAQYQPSQRFESAALSKVVPGVCYSPFHNKEYPLNGGGGNIGGLDAAMRNDFSIMKNYFSVVRTYYSSYYGVPVTPCAAAHGVTLFLGVFMTQEAWYAYQIQDAITAVRDHPGTVGAILVGNENISPVGPYRPSDIAREVNTIRARVLTETGRSVPVGTVQRATEWLDGSRRGEMLALAESCDIIGVNIYPFFDGNYNGEYPIVILNAIWDAMLSLYPASKLRLTEVGYPTNGAPPTYAARNIPSLANSRNFYNAFVNWNPSNGGNEAFWFMFFDRAPQDNSMVIELEKYFGFYTWDKASKAPDYPVLISARSQVLQSQPPPPPPPTPTPAATPAPTQTKTTTTAPPVPVPTTSSPVTPGVCRVRKVFLG